MAFGTYPIVIDFFPLLVAISAAVSFIVAYSISQRWVDPIHGNVSRLIKRAKLIVTLVVVTPMLLMFVVPSLGFWLDIEVLVSSFHVFRSFLHVVIVTLVGAFLGFALAIGYYIRGVAGYCLLTFLVLLLPVWAVLNIANAETILDFTLGEFDFLVLLLLILSWEPTWFMKKLLGGEEEMSKSAIAAISRDVARGYIAKSLESLRTRLEIDGDDIAREAIEVLQETEGTIGALISEAIVCSQSPKNMEDRKPEHRVEDLLSESYQASLRRAAMSKQPRPREIWMLTDSEFERRVKLNRFVYLILLFAMIGLTIGALTDMSLHANQWMGILSTGIIITSLVLAMFDNTFIDRRLGANSVVKQVLMSLSGIDELLIGEPSTGEEPTEKAEGEQMLEMEETEHKAVVLTDEHLVAASGHTRKFLERVKAGKNEVYEESIQPLYLGATGAIISIPPGIGALLTYTEPLSFFTDILIVLFLLGLPILVVGALWWYKWTQERSFHGIRRNILASAISYLDISEAGIEDIGFVVYPTPPGHVALLKLRGPMTARIALEKLGSSSSVQQDPAVLRETVEIEGRMLRFLCIIPVVLVITVAMLYVSISPIFTIIMLSLVLFSLVGSLYAYISYRRKRRTLVALEAKTESAEPVERLSQILGMVEREYAFPLRVHVIRTHKELLYTGTTFKTTTGVVLREAVYLPR